MSSLESESEQLINVGKIIFKQVEKLAGNPMILYKCQRMDGDDVRYFDLKYEFEYLSLGSLQDVELLNI